MPVNNFSGTVTAATFIGSGSQVTNIPASSITGSPWLRNSSNLGDVSSKYAAAGNVGILDMNFQTAHQGYEAKNLATASFAGQFGVSYYDQGNFYFWRARSTIKGDWFKCWGTSAGGNFVAGDPFSMSPSSAYMNYFWSMGNPSLQVYGPYNSVDAQNVAVNCNPYISGSGWLCALVTTNAAHGWSCITTNANGERIFKSDTFTSYLAVPEQAPEFNLPGFGVIVQNGNDPFALCSAYNLNGITGNYSYFQTAPYAHQLLFPVWRTNAWRSTSNNFAATKLDTYTGSWNFISNINVNGTIISGTNTTPTPSAALEVNSTTKGFLLPRMTKAQRDTITSPVAGLSVYQTDNIPGLRVYNGTKWVRYSEIED